MTMGDLGNAELVQLRAAIDAEFARRDTCEHGVATGEACAACRAEYGRARVEADQEGEG